MQLLQHLISRSLLTELLNHCFDQFETLLAERGLLRRPASTFAQHEIADARQGAAIPAQRALSGPQRAGPS